MDSPVPCYADIGITSLMPSGWLCRAGAWWPLLLLLRSGLGFELLGITSDLEGLLRRCTTQVAPCGPHRFVPRSPSRVRLRCKQGMGLRNFLARGGQPTRWPKTVTRPQAAHIEGIQLWRGLCRPLVLETPALQGSSCPHRHNQPHGI